MEDDPLEKWLPVYGYEGTYEVSNIGRVRRMSPYKTTFVGKILKPGLKSTGYYAVDLSRGNKAQTVWIHRIVACAFIGKCPPGLQVNHKNTVKTDNRVENLEYISLAENLHHARRAGIRWHSQKLNEHSVREILFDRSNGKKVADIAIDHGITGRSVYDILSKKTWRYLT